MTLEGGFSSNTYMLVTAVGAGTGNRGAAPKGGLSQSDTGSEPSCHVPQRTLCRSRMPRGVASAFVEGEFGRQQARQRRFT